MSRNIQRSGQGIEKLAPVTIGHKNAVPIGVFHCFPILSDMHDRNRRRAISGNTVAAVDIAKILVNKLHIGMGTHRNRIRKAIIAARHVFDNLDVSIARIKGPQSTLRIIEIIIVLIETFTRTIDEIEHAIVFKRVQFDGIAPQIDPAANCQSIGRRGLITIEQLTALGIDEIMPALVRIGSYFDLPRQPHRFASPGAPKVQFRFRAFVAEQAAYCRAQRLDRALPCQISQRDIDRRPARYRRLDIVDMVRGRTIAAIDHVEPPILTPMPNDLRTPDRHAQVVVR